MANPLACAAANASLDLFETEPRLKQSRGSSTFARGLEPCRAIRGDRCAGQGAIASCNAKPWDAAALRAKFAEQGFWIRPFGESIYLTRPSPSKRISSPPYLFHLRDAGRLAEIVMDMASLVSSTFSEPFDQGAILCRVIV